MIHNGTQERFISEITLGAGSTRKDGVIQSDSLLATLYVNSIASGNLSVSVYTLTDIGKQDLLFTFPTVTGPTVDLLLKKSGISLARFLIVATYTGVVDYEVYVRAVDGAGESSTRILGSSNWKTEQATVTTSAALLIPSSLTDRNGILIKNWDALATIYVAESLVNATTGSGYPLGPRDAIAMDLSAGAEVYAVSDSSPADVRIVQSGT